MACYEIGWEVQQVVVIGGEICDVDRGYAVCCVGVAVVVVVAVVVGAAVVSSLRFAGGWWVVGGTRMCGLAERPSILPWPVWWVSAVVAGGVAVVMMAP